MTLQQSKKEKRGRRLVTAVPPDVRIAQLREGQRRHRERKLNYVKELEERAANADKAWARVAELEATCGKYKAELAQIRASIAGQASSSFSTIFESSDFAKNQESSPQSSDHDGTFSSSVAVNGPLLDVESSKEQLYSIPVLKDNSSLVEQFFETIK
ncbi:hypothetical protein HK100_009009, partial [Physocladia obscura]